MAMTIDELVDAVAFRCEQRLGHLGKIIVQKFYYDTEIGVALELPDGRRHAVMAEVMWSEPEPVELADAMADKLLEWHAGLGT